MLDHVLRVLILLYTLLGIQCHVIENQNIASLIECIGLIRMVINKLQVIITSIVSVDTAYGTSLDEYAMLQQQEPFFVDVLRYDILPLCCIRVQ